MTIVYAEAKSRLSELDPKSAEFFRGILDKLEEGGESSVDRAKMSCEVSVSGGEKFRICIGWADAPGSVCIEL